MRRASSWSWLVCVVLVSAQSAAQPTAVPSRPPAKAKAPAPAPAKGKLVLSAKEIAPGDPVLVTVTGVADRPKGTAGQTPLVFFAVVGGWQAVFATPLENAPESVKVTVDGDLTGSVAIKAHEFPREEHIKVAPELGSPPVDKKKTIDADNIAVIDAAKNDDPPLFTGKWGRPGTGPASSPYGAIRTFNDDAYESRHLGQDVAAALGAPVRSVQRGKVTLVRDGYLMGGTVVVSHGGGVASAYHHLTDMTVKVGDEIPAGKVLGKVGMTGRTTGPHIHLGIWVPNGWVNPATFMKLGFKPLRTPPAAAKK
jgi:murein DD-endopeptidase MepM/ murein hydrolase activator NlpD